MPLPFEVTFAIVEVNLDAYVDEVFGVLQSEFLILPRGDGFIDYPVFEQAYEALQGVSAGQPPRFEVIACIAGGGIKVRREDMKKLLIATRGKVFTLETIRQMVGCTRLADFAVQGNQ